MKNAAHYMQAAIDRAAMREAEIRARDGKRIFAGHASGCVDTPKGKIMVNFVVAQGVSTLLPQHMRQTWTLEGKRISRDKLIAELS
jgi:hypothetical protein